MRALYFKKIEIAKGDRTEIYYQLRFFGIPLLRKQLSHVEKGGRIVAEEEPTIIPDKKNIYVEGNGNISSEYRKGKLIRRIIKTEEETICEEFDEKSGELNYRKINRGNTVIIRFFPDVNGKPDIFLKETHFPRWNIYLAERHPYIKDKEHADYVLYRSEENERCIEPSYFKTEKEMYQVFLSLISAKKETDKNRKALIEELGKIKKLSDKKIYLRKRLNETLEKERTN